MKSVPYSALSLNGLRLKVHLGCSEEERRVPQFVRFEILLRFKTPPLGCQTDQLSDTVCYAQISDILRTACEGEFQLIEKLGWKVFSLLKQTLPKDVQVQMRMIKEKPPISDLTEGSSFYLSDWEIF